MRYTLSRLPAQLPAVLLSLLLATGVSAQTDSPDTLIARLGYSQCIVTARQLKGDSVVGQARHVQTIGPNGRTKSYVSYDQNGKQYSKIEYEYDATRQVVTGYDYDKTGRLEYRHIDICGPNFYQRIQIRAEDGDTLNSGKWVMDIHGRDSLFYRYGKLYTRYRYNASGDLVEEKRYAPNGKSDGTWRYVVKRKGKIRETYDTENGQLFLRDKRFETPEKTIVYDLQKSTGYLYGIRLDAEKDGKRITYRNNEGLVVARVYETAKGKVYARIDFEYRKTP